MNLTEFQKITNSPTAVTLPAGVSLSCSNYNIIPTGAASGFASSGSESILGPNGITTSGMLSAGGGLFNAGADGSFGNSNGSCSAGGAVTAYSLDVSVVNVGSGLTYINGNGSISAASGAFQVNYNGSFLASDGYFDVASDGSLSINLGAAYIISDGSFGFSGFSGNQNDVYVTNTLHTPILIVGNTSPLHGILTAVATLNFPSTFTGVESPLTMVVTGAEVGDVVSLGVHPDAMITGANYQAYVSNADEVTILYQPTITGNPPSADFCVTILKF